MSVIKIDNLCKIYGKKDTKVKALTDINLEINKGEMVAIIGTSGSGKSTMLNIIGCLESPTSGDYYLNNTGIHDHKNKDLSRIRNQEIGFILQDFALIEKYTVERNLKIPFEYNKTKIKRYEQTIIINSLLKKLGIYEKRKEYVHNLSGGQKQRVAIARALINKPKLILADEPTGSLDSKNTKEILNLLKELNNENVTILIVTHDMEVAKNCPRIIQLNDGKIINDFSTNKEFDLTNKII